MDRGVHPVGTDPYFEDHRAETAYIHESSYIDSPCRIGEHTTILHFSHVMAHSIIGSHCLIGRHVSIASGVMMGDHVKVMNNAQLNSGVILESSVLCGTGVVFSEGRYMRAHPGNLSRVSPTLVRKGAQLGPNSTIASGSTIGRYAFIEAGTIVDRNIPDFAVVYGNPLRLAGWRCKCGHSLSLSPEETPTGNEIQETQCSYCSRKYARHSRWKILALTQGEISLDSDSEFDPPVRAAQGQD